MLKKWSHLTLATPSMNVHLATKAFYESLGFKVIRSTTETETDLHLFSSSQEGGMTLRLVVRESNEHSPIQLHSLSLDNVQDTPAWNVFTVDNVDVCILEKD